MCLNLVWRVLRVSCMMQLAISDQPNWHVFWKTRFTIIVRLCWDFGNEIIITSVMNTTEENFLYCREALKMPHTMNKEALLSEQLWKKYKALKFCNTFPMEKPFNYNPLKLTCWHKARQVSCPNASSVITIILCTKIIVNIKHGFPSHCCCFVELLVELYHLHNFSKCESQ